MRTVSKDLTRLNCQIIEFGLPSYFILFLVAIIDIQLPAQVGSHVLTSNRISFVISETRRQKYAVCLI